MQGVEGCWNKSRKKVKGQIGRVSNLEVKEGYRERKYRVRNLDTNINCSGGKVYFYGIK